MTYVIAQNCVGVKNASCVQVCPVDCIHPLPGEPGYDDSPQLYINPAECVDCHSCAEACPVDAAMPEEDLPPDWSSALDVNAAYFAR
jgi:ferredoxin